MNVDTVGTRSEWRKSNSEYVPIATSSAMFNRDDESRLLSLCRVACQGRDERRSEQVRYLWGIAGLDSVDSGGEAIGSENGPRQRQCHFDHPQHA